MKLERLIGQVLDSKYHLDKLLGQGGMGAVFLATHLGTKRPVALKVIAPQFMANEEVSERFRREAEAAGRLRHPNVVNVTDFGVTAFEREKLAYLVMEYLDGASLGEMMKQRGKLPLPLVVDIVEQTCLAIGTAHKLGIIHRDLKPDNILLQPDGRGGYIIKVLDFGLAKLRDVSEGATEVNSTATNAADTITRAVGNQTAHAPERTTAEVKASTQFQPPDATELETATQLQSPSLPEAEAATLMQSPTSTVNEAATLLQAPKSPEIEAATLIQPAITSPEEQTRIMDADGESATLIQPAGAAFNGNAPDEETVTRIQTDTVTHAEKPPSRPTAVNDVSVTTSASVELTRIGSILGTPLYMSPEQCKGENLDSHSDIYSLGVIIYQMLAGEPPFSGTMTELMTKHCDNTPPSLKEKRDDVPSSVVELVNAALAKNPAERPASAETFATALHATAETETEVLQQAKASYYSSQRVFFLASLFLYLPCAIVSLAVSIGLGDTLSSNPVAATIFYIVLFSLVLIATKWNAALSTLLLEKQRLSPNTPIPLKPVLKVFASRIVPLTGSIVQSYLHILWGFVRFIRPGGRAAVNAALVAPVAVMEEKRGGAALARSAALVQQLRLVALAFTLRDFGVCLWSLVLFPGITVLMTYIFGGTRTNAISLLLLPMIRNFIAGYSWVLLTMLHTVYAAVPLGLLYFKALQAKGESLASSGVRDWQSESRKKANQLGKATVAWIALPSAMALFMILSGVITSRLETSVIDAVRHGRLETLKRLLAKGKNPNDTNFGTSALMFAAQAGQTEILKALLEKGANVKQVDGDGDDALIYAAIDNRVEAMKELIGAGADRNWQNKKGNTALLSAAQKGRTAAVQCLLAAGADPNLKNKEGKTALAVAEAEGHLETAQLLKAAGQ
jgi:serine/threonine protein kinase